MDMTKRDVQYHIGLGQGDAGGYCILPGDPGRCERIAALLDNRCFVHSNREFTTWAGTLEGEKVSVVSTGIGGPSAAIAVEELHQIGVHTFLRIGTCGGIRLDVQSGDVVVATGAVRMEGTSREYAPLEYPAVPDYHVLSALVRASEQLGKSWHAGVVQCKDSFYGQHSPETMPAAQTLLQNWQAWKAAGALASEMESAALFIVAATRRVKCATILQMLWNQERQAVVRDNAHAAGDMTHAIEVAVSAMRREIRQGKKEEM